MVYIAALVMIALPRKFIRKRSEATAILCVEEAGSPWRSWFIGQVSGLLKRLSFFVVCFRLEERLARRKAKLAEMKKAQAEELSKSDPDKQDVLAKLQVHAPTKARIIVFEITFLKPLQESFIWSSLEHSFLPPCNLLGFFFRTKRMK